MKESKALKIIEDIWYNKIGKGDKLLDNKEYIELIELTDRVIYGFAMQMIDSLFMYHTDVKKATELLYFFLTSIFILGYEFRDDYIKEKQTSILEDFNGIKQ